MEGTLFGRYRLIELLGRGDTGELWRAHDTEIDRVVALKMLLPHYAQDPEFAERFRREARTAAQLEDPHVPVYDVGEIDGRLYVTMRLGTDVDVQALLAETPLAGGQAVPPPPPPTQQLPQPSPTQPAPLAWPHAPTEPVTLRSETPRTPPMAPTQPVNTGAPPPLPPAPPFGSQPPAEQRPGRRRALVIAALVAVAALVLAGGLFAGITLSQRDEPTPAAAPDPTTAAPESSATPPVDEGPFTGLYRADFGPVTKIDDVAIPGALPSTANYAVRSACRPTGCVAIATRLTGDTNFATTLEFDQIDGRWRSVALANAPCSGRNAEIWEVYTLDPAPGTADGDSAPALSGVQTRSGTTICQEKRTMTFTRTGPLDEAASPPDPNALPPRVVSPAEALRGHYRLTRTFKGGGPQPLGDSFISTDCLRSGERCMSYFTSTMGDVPLVFGNGNWIAGDEADGQCPDGSTAHLKTSALFPLPQPVPNPIPELSGGGRWTQTGGCPVDIEFDETFTRTGD